MKCWIDGEPCPDGNRIISGIINAGVCRNCIKVSVHREETESFIFELLGTTKEDWLEEESPLQKEVQEFIIQNSFVVYSTIKKLQKLLSRELSCFSDKIIKAENVSEMRKIVEDYKEILLISAKEEWVLEALKTLDSKGDGSIIKEDFLIKIEDLCGGDSFFYLEEFEDIVEVFNRIDHLNC